MKRLPKIILTTLCMLGCFWVMAQDSAVVDSTGTGTGGENGSGSGILDAIIEKAGIIIPIILTIYELIARLVPTLKDQSLVNNIVKGLQWILDKLVPNKAKVPESPDAKAVHKSVEVTQTKQ